MGNCYVLLFLAVFFNRVYSWCWWHGCCVDKASVIEGLEKNLSKNVFGQHLVNEPILTAISAHLEHQPQKALVLSFHGPSGVGKTTVAKKIAYHMFNGDTRYIKFYSGRNDFQDHVDIAQNKMKLAKEISETVFLCPHSIFIFDESDQMANGLFDVLRPYTDYYEEYHGIDYRRAIFIFLSNIGASEISRKYYEKRSVPRDSLTLTDFEEVLSAWLLNHNGGFKDSTLVINFLIDWMVPFLPLTEEHIKMCIVSSLNEKGFQHNPQIISSIFQLLPRKKEHQDFEYIPSNCKKIDSEVGKYVQSMKRRQNKVSGRDEF